MKTFYKLILLTTLVIYNFTLIFTHLIQPIGYRVSDLIFLFYSEYNEIVKNLWISNYNTAIDYDFLNNHNIKLVVNLSKNLKFINLDIDKYRVPIHDNRTKESDEGLIKHFPNVYNKIDEHLSKNEGVLIHCRSGMQRSATTIALYLMKKYNISFIEAKELIQNKRPFALRPLTNFKNVIKYFEKNRFS